MLKRFLGYYKPHKKMMALDMLAALGVEKENAWMIGDLPADYKVSVNAGVNHVIADWGYGKKKKFPRIFQKFFLKLTASSIEYERNAL